jgi:hypothetical protein
MGLGQQRRAWERTIVTPLLIGAMICVSWPPHFRSSAIGPP